MTTEVPQSGWVSGRVGDVLPPPSMPAAGMATVPVGVLMLGAGHRVGLTLLLLAGLWLAVGWALA